MKEQLRGSDPMRLVSAEKPVTERRPRVLIVSDTRMYRDGLTTQLAARGELDVVGAAASLAETVVRVRELSPDVVLCDTALPGGLESARVIAALEPKIPVVVFAVPDNEVDIPACAEAGVAGFVTRDASVDDLTASVLGVARGEIVCSPKATAALYRRLATLSAAREAPANVFALTVREREIVMLLDRGMSNKQIAQLLGIGIATAKNHVHHILEKLRVQRRTEVRGRVRRDP